MPPTYAGSRDMGRGMGIDVGPTPNLQPAHAADTRPMTEIYLGGPDQPPGALRDLLKARVDAAPPGSEITWATYYFRDQGLAESLVAAERRGVRVRIRVEGSPRRSKANDAVIATLREGLGDGLRLHRSWFGAAHLHAKVYAFSGPQPEVLIGSFNPSGDAIPDRKLLADIGDQDRGQNLLVGFRDPETSRALRRQAERLWAGKGGRFGRRENRPVKLQAARLYYFPRLRPDVVERRIARLGPGDRVQAAISHMDDGPFAKTLAAAAARGADVELVVHETRRRVPNGVVRELDRAGAHVRRYCDPEGLPMHAKFVVIDDGGARSAWFGSLNYTVTSRYLNREILARSTDGAVVSDLEARFRAIAETADAQASTCGAKRRAAAAAAGAHAR